MESPFTHLLTTNYVPSKDEIEKINDLLINPVNQLNLLNTEIARLQGLIETLTTQRNQLHNSILGHRGLMAPMRRIPRELLQEIFVHCLPTQHNAIMSSREAPLLLGRVCSLWRNVAMSTPKLWSSIHIAVLGDPPWGGHPEPPEDGNIHVEAVETWLSRSGTLPLSISLFCPHMYDTAHEKLLLSTLISFSSRWCNVTILASTVSFSIIASLSQEAVPLLNILSLHQICSSPTEQFQLMPCNIYRAPYLREVSSSHSVMIPPNINWSQLTTLSIGKRSHGPEELTPELALDILRLCVNLTSCRVEFGPGIDDSLNNYHGTALLPALETLIVAEGYTTLVSFFKHLDLPALINLEFSAPAHMEIEDHPSICTLLSRVDKLENFTISSYNITRHALLECIKEAPASIKQFSVLRSPYSGWFTTPENAFDNEVLELLTPTEAAKPVFPCLKIVECNPCRVSDEALLTFIQARTKYASANGVRRLERVDINFDREREMDIISASGLDISNVNLTLTYEPHIRQRRHVPWAGLEQPRRLEMTTKPFNYNY